MTYMPGRFDQSDAFWTVVNKILCPCAVYNLQACYSFELLIAVQQA
jgi:hypothetical protein